jgi:hypothetical protein
MKNLFYGFCAAPRFYTTKVIRDRVGQGRRWYLFASLRKRPKYCSAKNERNCQSGPTTAIEDEIDGEDPENYPHRQ